MNKTKFSIIIPVWNQEKLLVRALDSIPNRDDLEVIIVDDCSTDNTLEVIKNYNRISLKIFHNDINKGSGYSRNLGMSKATGEWLYALDSDDYYDIDSFNTFLDNFNYDNYDIVHVGIRINSGLVWTSKQNMCGFPTMLIRREFCKNVQCQEINVAEDWYFLKELRTFNPREINVTDCFYNYNYPREGSLIWNRNHNK